MHTLLGITMRVFSIPFEERVPYASNEIFYFSFQIPSKTIPAPLYGLLFRACDWHGAKLTFVPEEKPKTDLRPFDDLAVHVFTVHEFAEKFSGEG